MKPNHAPAPQTRDNASKATRKPKRGPRCQPRALPDDPKALAKLYRKQQDAYRSLMQTVKWFIARFDQVMREMPNSLERGKQIARLTNALELAREHAELFGLHTPLGECKNLSEAQLTHMDNYWNARLEEMKKVRADVAHWQRVAKEMG